MTTFVRQACPGCGFPLRVRVDDRPDRRVRCSVCAQRALVEIERGRGDGAFREAASLALVPLAATRVSHRGQLVFDVIRKNPHGTRLAIAWAAGLAALIPLVSFGLGVYVGIPLLLALAATVIVGADRREVGHLDEGELELRVERAWSSRTRLQLADARVRVEARADRSVVIVESDDAVVRIGETAQLTTEEAEEIAARLRGAAGSVRG